MKEKECRRETEILQITITIISWDSFFLFLFFQMIGNSIQIGLIFFFKEYFDSYNRSRVDQAQMH